MTLSTWGLLLALLACLFIFGWPLGRALAALCNGSLPRWMLAVERPFLRAAGIGADPAAQAMGWKTYALALVAFNAVGAFWVYALQRLQASLPLNPAGMSAITPDSAFNTAVSFVTNTNWQGYGGESSMGYLVQMVGLAGQNFFSAATGIAVVFALMRGFAARSSGSIGNFWVDLVRITGWLLVPLSLVLALVFVGQGTIQNLSPYKEVTLVEPLTYAQPQTNADGTPALDAAGAAITKATQTTTQTLAMGPVASQEAIKMLGTNGGGFFNANSAHPFENPTAFSNFLQMFAIFCIPAALCFTFGRVVGDQRQGIAVLAAMTVLFVAAVVASVAAESAGNPVLADLTSTTNATAPTTATASGSATATTPAQMLATSSPGNLEGKELRFGIDASALFAVVTTSASCGAVNSMHDSYTPLGGMVPMVQMQLGEVVFGGVGTGLYGMLVFAMLAVFLSGLMIGRTPEYLGKKIEAHEMKLASMVILITPMLVLLGTALATMTEAGRAGIANPGAHGFSEILYATTSAANNNGSAFAGLSANTPFYNTLLAVLMWFGRFGVIVPVLAIAGALARKNRLPATAGTMPTHGPLFVMLLIGTVLLVGLLNFVPALALGPVVEHLMLWQGR